MQKKYVLALFLIILFFASGALASCSSDGYLYSQLITLKTTTSGITADDTKDLPILIDINSSNTSFWAHVDSNGNDIRFYNGANNATFNYHFNDWSYAGQRARIWVKVTDTFTSASDTSLYLCYGKVGAAVGANAAATYDGNFVAVYHADDAAGNMSDSTGNKTAATRNGNPAAGAAKVGDGAVCDGTGDFYATGWDYSAATAYSLVLWVKDGSVQMDDITLGNYEGDTDYFQLYTDIDKTPDAYHFDAKTSGTSAVSIVYVGDTTQWSHLVFSYGGADLNGFLNGKLASTAAATGTLTNAVEYYLCGRKTYADSFSGTIDEVWFMNSALSKNDVNLIYASQNQTAGFISFGAEQGPAPDANITFNVYLKNTTTALTGVTADWNNNAYDVSGQSSPFTQDVNIGHYLVAFSRTGYDSNSNFFVNANSNRTITIYLADSTAPSVGATTLSGFDTFGAYIKGTGTIVGGTATDAGSDVNQSTCEYTTNGGWVAATWNTNHCEKTAYSVSDGTAYTFNTRVKDNAGNQGTGTATSAYTGDTIAPTTSIAGCTNIWHGANQTFTLSCSDARSGCANSYYRIDGGGWNTYSSGVVLSTDGNHQLDFYSVDNVTNQEAALTSWCAIDKTAPTTTDNSDTAWHGGDQTITLSCNDGVLSGCNNTYYCIDTTNTCTPTTAGVSASVTCTSGTKCSQYVRYYSNDKSTPTNTESVKNSNLVKIDKELPIVGATTLTGYTTFGAFIKGNGNVIGGTADDNSGSGLDTTTCEYSILIAPSWAAATWSTDHCVKTSAGAASNGVSYSYNTRIKDNVANQGAGTATPTYTGDTAAPTTTPSGCLTSGWNNTTQSIDLICSDGAGSGCALTQYKLDGGAWTTYGATINLTTDGNHQIDYNSIDNLGNTETTGTYWCAVDKTAPTTTISTSQEAGTADMNIQLVCADANSGCKTLAYSFDLGTWKYIDLVKTEAGTTTDDTERLESSYVYVLRATYNFDYNSNNKYYPTAITNQLYATTPGDISHAFYSLHFQDGTDENTAEEAQGFTGGGYITHTYSFSTKNKPLAYIQLWQRKESAITNSTYTKNTTIYWDRNHYSLSNSLSLSLSGTGPHNIRYYSSDLVDNNESMNSTSFNTYGFAHIAVKDENTFGNLSGVSVVIDGTTYIVNTSQDINLGAISSGAKSISFTKALYGTRYYEADLNAFSEPTINMLLAPTSISGDVGFQFYSPDGNNLVPNVYAELYRPDKSNWIIGRRLLDATAKAIFNLNLVDQNYLELIADTNIYSMVALSVLYPKNEVTNLQITETWLLNVTGAGTGVYSNLSAAQILYVVPNTLNGHNLKVQDMNSIYFPRDYVEDLFGNPGTASLQPYLLPYANGISVKIQTFKQNDLSILPFPFVDFKVYKDSGAGKTLIMDSQTDAKGEALAILVTGDTYIFNLDYNGSQILFSGLYDVSLKVTGATIAFTISSTSSTLIDANMFGYAVKWNEYFIPWSAAGTRDINFTFYNPSARSTTLVYYLDFNGTTFAGPFTTTFSDTNKDLSITLDWASFPADANSFRLVISATDNFYGTTSTYYKTYQVVPAGAVDVLGLFVDARNELFSCNSSSPCVPSAAVWFFLSLGVVIVLMVRFGMVSSINPLAFVAMMALGTFVGWVPIEVTALMAIAGIGLYLMERR